VNRQIQKATARGYQIFHEMAYQVAERIAAAYLNGAPEHPWNVVPAATLLRVWKSHAALGVVRDERTLDDIAAVFIDNTLRLSVNTELAAHGSLSTEEALESYDLADRISDPEAFVAWAIDTPAGWRISDGAIAPLTRYAARLIEGPQTDEKMMILDTMLGITHPRSDLASWFVEGGQTTLSRLAMN